MIKIERLGVTTTGANGSATGNTTTSESYSGRLVGVGIDFHASAPASTVVTITEVNGMARTLFTAPAGNTDITYYPTIQLCDSTGTALTYDGTRKQGAPVPFYDKLKATVTLSNALTACAVVWLYIEV